MKMTKRILAFALTLMLLLSLSVPAFAVKASGSAGSADEPQYKATKDFLADIEGADSVEAAFEGSTTIANTGYEIVAVTYSGDKSQYISHMKVLFNEKGDELIVAMEHVFNFNEADLQAVMSDVNHYNAASIGPKLYVDTENLCINAELYEIATPETVVDVAEISLGFMVGFTDVVYEDFQVYDKAA